MNKKILFALGVLAVLGVAQLRALDNKVASTYATLEVTAASGTIFTGSGWIKGITFSSAPESTPFAREWLVLIDTRPADAITFARFTSATKRTPALIFQSTTTVNIETNPNPTWFAEPGIYFSTGAYYFKTSANSGEALKAFIHYTR